MKAQCPTLYGQISTEITCNFVMIPVLDFVFFHFLD